MPIRKSKKKSPKKKNEETLHHHAGREISSGGVIYRKKGRLIEVALISVKGGKRWGLPKGLQEPGENLARTAHREVAEETGLEGKIVTKIDEINYFYTYKDEFESKKVFKIVYFFLMEFTSGDTNLHDDEVDDCRFFEINEAIELMTYPDEREIITKAKALIDEIKSGS
ncbi:MAG: NUDIX hydrolase [Thermodesulfobacteriota bacterium]